MSRLISVTTVIPVGRCQCGCGESTRIPTTNDRVHGWVAGVPLRYVHRHRNRATGPDFALDLDTGCWEWLRARQANGYGKVANQYAHQYAHRLYYERYVGPIGEGLEIDHLCFNPGCVNPRHLEAVPHAVNAQRRRTSKLTPAAVTEIRESSETAAVLAMRFGVGRNAIYRVRRNERWAP